MAAGGLMRWEAGHWRELMSGAASDERAYELLFFVGFHDWEAALARLRQIGRETGQGTLLAEALPGLLTAIAETANPDQALVNFERFSGSVGDPAALFEGLANNPRTVEVLSRLFTGSQYLTEILLRTPGYLDALLRHRTLAELKSVQQLYEEAQQAMRSEAAAERKLDALRRFQQWELLRIGLCDFFGLLDLRRVTVQLSLLADSLVQAALDVAYGSDGVPRQGLAVIAMGKLGGEELNYSSDIDLLFVADQNAQTHWRVAQRLIKGLTAATGDGFLYRVDMRLRPWGKSGELVSSVEAHLGYLREHAQLWEKQALLKARVIAGDFRVGAMFLRGAQPLLFGTPIEVARERVSATKARIEADLERKGRSWGEVKLGQGSIRDVEFLVQFLQLVHGQEHPAVRGFNTLDALVRLTDHGFLQADEYRVLTDGYVFFRTIEHALQLMHNKQTHELPADPGELMSLARRLDFGSDSQFLEHFSQHRRMVRAVYERYLGQKTTSLRAEPNEPGLSPPETRRHVARMVASYTRAFGASAVERHAALASAVSAERPVVVESERLSNGDWRVTIVGYDYPGELSLICGLLLVHGFNIVEGQVFTYERLAARQTPTAGEQRAGSGPRTSAARRRLSREPDRPPTESDQGADWRRKIVDVFTVRNAAGTGDESDWLRYGAELAALLAELEAGRGDEAHGRLATRVAATLRERTPTDVDEVLYPIEIELDNSFSEQYSVLLIRSRDTLGFLYELTSALALCGVYIAQLSVGYALGDACDTLYVTDAQGCKIEDPARQQELKAAVVLIKHFTHLLPRSPNPETALLHFREFVADLFAGPNWLEEIASLERREVLDALARLLGVSDFLWSDFLRMQHANLFPVVRDVGALEQARSRDALAAELSELLTREPDLESRRRVLNEFKDREMFRVDMREILGRIRDYSQFHLELTDLAEVVVEAACTLAASDLKTTLGIPLGADGAACTWCVCALGKCGGRELGYASDIELMFVYSGPGRTAGQPGHAASEYYARFVDHLLHSIRARREGIFEIDLRLRPYGRAGSTAVSVDSFREYFGPQGPAWPYERQALVKLRPIAGDSALGQAMVRLRDQVLYTGEPFDVAAMRGMRERQQRQLVTPGSLNAKLSPGGLVDLEYLVQGLQITHGAAHPQLRSTNTRDAIQALTEAGVITADDGELLSSAYVFLRRLIGGMRIVRGNIRDLTVPEPGSEEFAFLARRLDDAGDIAGLQADLVRHTTTVQDLTHRLLG